MVPPGLVPVTRRALLERATGRERSPKIRQTDKSPVLSDVPKTSANADRGRGVAQWEMKGCLLQKVEFSPS